MPYLGRSPGSGVRTRFIYAATAGQTSFSGNDSNSVSLAYEDTLYMDVYQNGVLLKPVTDYAATTGTSVVLTTGATTDDVVEMIVYDTFAVADTVSAKDGGTFAGNMSMGGTLTLTGNADFNGDLDVDGTTNLDVVDIDGAVDMASTLQVDGAITSSVGATITTADNTTQLTLKSTDADATEGPRLDFHRDSSSPADGDVAGVIRFLGDDNGGNTVNMAELEITLDDITAGSDDATIKFHVMNAGTRRNNLKIGGTEVVINEDSQDIDFRVESLSDANSFVVEGATKGIGMGTNDPTIDSSLAGVSVPSGSRVLHIHDTDSAYLKITDPDTGSNRGVQLAMIGTDAILNNCEGGSFKFGNGNTLAMTLNSSRALGIGKTPDASVSTVGTEIEQNGKIIMSRAAACPLFINRSNDGVIVQFSNSGSTAGTISVASGPSTAYNTSSDYRLKENVDYTWDATTRFKQLKPARFNFIANADTTVDGFLAHEVSNIVPEAITGTKDETRTVSNAILSASGALLFENITQDDWTAGKLATKDAEGNDVDALYPSDSTWTANHTEPVMQGIDQSKLVPLLVKTILELEARITALEA